MQLTAFRRTLAVGAVWAAAMAGLLATSPSASGQEADVPPGRGQAFAQGVKVDPRTGRLSFGVTYGQALAGHQNTIALAEAHSADLGLLGDQLGAESCSGGDPIFPKEDQPQPLTARSNGEGAGTEQVESENGVEKRVFVDETPYARAVSVTNAAGDGAAIQFGATRSTTESGIVDGRRLARAVTVVEHLALGGGQVVLQGLRWEALYQTAPTEEAAGSFRIEGITIGGQEIAFPEDNPLEGLAQANAALAPLGFTIDPPVAKRESGIQFVGPLRIGIVPSSTRESVIGPLFNGVQPVRESLFDALIEADCRAASGITVLDIVLGSVSGAGSLGLEVGGVTATSAAIDFTSFLGGIPGAPSLPSLPSTSSGRPSLGTPGRTSSPSLPATPSLGATGGGAAATGDGGAADPTAGDEAPIADLEPLTGSRGGALAGVGLGGLALLAALAAADRAKMRKAQRSVLMETF